MKLRTAAALVLLLACMACRNTNPVGSGDPPPPPEAPTEDGGWLGSGH